MKKITDYFKRLLGLPSLELWEPGGPILSQVLDVDSAIDRIAYLYCNPARANLVESINEYPGFSSWEWFGSNPNAKELGENVPWIRQPSIPALGPRTLSRGQDRNLTANLRLKNSKYSHSLLIRPNAIYEAFDIHDEHEIALHNQELLRQIEMREKEFSDNRRRAGRHVAGSARLRDEPILKAHTPEKKATDRKVLFHTTSKQLALAFLEQFAEFRQKCLMAYRAWRSGNFFAQWPPGAFRPPLCPVANALA